MSEPLDFCKLRMGHLKKLMAEQELDVVYLTRAGQLFKKLTDCGSGSALVIPLDGQPMLFCPSVDINSSREESWVPVTLMDREKGAAQVADYVNRHLRGKARIGVNVGGFTYQGYSAAKESLKGEPVDIGGTLLSQVFSGLYPDEVRLQRAVSRLADVACSAARETIAPGVTEIEVAAEANYAMMRGGAELQSFTTIVSSGERSAYSHGWPTDRVIREGDLVIVDLGPSKLGYASDETRTFLVGGNPHKRRMLAAVDEAVQASIDAVKPGAVAGDVDAVSRRVLAARGYPDYPHTLGHPLSGCLVPALSRGSEQILKPGMLMTIEPGIYLPTYGGVRLEENVIVTEDGYEQLTHSPRVP